MKPLLQKIFAVIALFVTFEAYSFNACALYPPRNFQNQMQIWLKDGLQMKAFESWVFKPGALFESSDIWWKTKTNYVREFPHEGVDFYYFQAKMGNELLHVAEGTAVPLIYNGKLESVFKDFIGFSLVFSTNEFQQIDGKKFKFYVLYAHVRPIKPLTKEIGKQFTAGNVLFTYNYQYKNFAPAHLHLTTFWADEQFNPKDLSWEIIDKSKNLILINPLLSSIHPKATRKSFQHKEERQPGSGVSDLQDR